jgi:hypothetical protein
MTLVKSHRRLAKIYHPDKSKLADCEQVPWNCDSVYRKLSQTEEFPKSGAQISIFNQIQRSMAVNTRPIISRVILQRKLCLLFCLPRKRRA